MKENIPRVGHIQFLNCLPLYYGLVNNGAILGVKLTKGTPTQLNRWLVNGDLDISPISAIEYARNAADLILLPKLCVSSDGEVKSILLVGKVPAEDLAGEKVALANTSRTSQALVKMILKDKYKVEPEYVERPVDLPAMLQTASAALLIGDPALRALRERNGLYKYDLGAEWKELTGRGMVYAVWAVRRAYQEAYPGSAEDVCKDFLASMRYSMLNADAIADDAALGKPFDAEFLKAYFATLRFDLDDKLRRDFLVFLAGAEDSGYLDAVPKLEFIKVTEDRYSEGKELVVDRRPIFGGMKKGRA